MRRFTFSFAMLLVPALSVNSLFAADPKLDEIVAKYEKAIGGIEANKKVKTRQLEGTIDVSGQGPWKMTITQKAPNLRRVEADIPNVGTIVEVFDGKNAWRHIPGVGTMPMSEEETAQEKRESNLYALVDLKADFPKLSYEGKETVDGTPFFVLQGTSPDDTKVKLYINVNTYMLGRMTTPFFNGGELDIRMSDYQKVDGVAVARRLKVSGPVNVNMEFTNVTNNLTVNDAMFTKPGE